MTTFKINKEKDDPANSLYYIFTFSGKHDFEDDNGYPMLEVEDDEDLFSLVDAFAIKVVKGDKTNYYVKRGKHGRLFNPIGLYSEGTAAKQLRHAGRPEWRFETTSAKVFNYYIQFLRTKNAAWLNNAEREV